MSGSLTRVALVHVQRRINVYLRFGRAAHVAIIDRYRRIAYFRPGTVFCRVRWEANEYGTTLWQLLVLQASSPRKSMQCIADVAPGAAILLHADGARKVK